MFLSRFVVAGIGGVAEREQVFLWLAAEGWVLTGLDSDQIGLGWSKVPVPACGVRALQAQCCSVTNRPENCHVSSISAAMTISKPLICVPHTQGTYGKP